MPQTFLKLPISLDGDVLIPTDSEEFKGKIRAELDCDSGNLEEELIASPAKLWFWGYVFAFHQNRRDVLKDAMNDIEAELYIQYKTKPREAEPKPTEALTKAWVESHPSYQKARDAVRAAEELVGLAEHAMWAFKGRHQGLLKLAEMEMAKRSLNVAPDHVLAPRGHAPQGGRGPHVSRWTRTARDEGDLTAGINETKKE